jgi:hypothetical protein
MSTDENAAKRSIEFFSAANLEEVTARQVGSRVEAMDVRFAEGIDKDALSSGSALFSKYMKSFGSDFDELGLHIGVIEFAPGLVSPLHSHSDDCAYYVERGSIILGNRTLGPGEGFVSRKDQPYGFVVGPDGLRLIEFTTGRRRDITFHERHASAWKRRLEKAVAKLNADPLA